MPLTVLSKKGAPLQMTTVSRRVDPENSSNKRIANVEKDYLGMINFCLLPTDTTLSGNSRSKLLNEATNDVFRALMVGNAAVLEDTLSRLKVFKDQCENIPFNVQDDEIKAKTRNIANESDDIYNSLNKIDLLPAILALIVYVPPPAVAVITTYLTWLDVPAGIVIEPEPAGATKYVTGIVKAIDVPEEEIV